MSFFALSGLMNGLVSTTCGATVFFLNPRSRKNILYALYCISLSVWSYFYCAWQTTNDPDKALFYVRGLMMGAIFIPTFHYHHILSLFDLGSPKRRKILYSAYGLTALCFIANFTPLFIETVEPRLGFLFWPVPGPLFHPYLVMFLVLLTFSLIVIWDFRNKTSALIRNSMAWVAFATLFGYGGGATNFPLWYDIPIKPILNFTVSFYVAINARLFFKHKLLDFQLASRNVIGWLFNALISAFPFFVAAYFTRLLWTWPGFALNNGPGPLICTVLSSAIFLTTATVYQNPYARRLCHFSVLLGLWNFTALFLCVSKTAISIWVYRFGYGIGCLALLAWFSFWQEYFYQRTPPSPSFNRCYKTLAWLAFLLAAFSPFILDSLFFDPMRLTTALIIPGTGHSTFSIWFLIMVVLSSFYPIRGWWRSKDRKNFQVGFVLFATFLLAGGAATTYFLFVEGKSAWCWYPILEFIMLLFLMWALILRMPTGEGRTQAWWSQKLAGFGLSVLAVSLVVGFLLAQKTWYLVAAGGILGGLSLTAISQAIRRPVQEWVDQTFVFRRDFGHLAKSKETVKKQWDLDSLEDALPMVARQVLETAPYRSCTIAIMFDDQPKRPFFRSTQLRMAQGELISGIPWSEKLVFSFLQMTRKNKGVILREEVMDLPSDVSDLDPLLFEAAAPLVIEEKIVGFVVMGAKEGQKATFHNEDIKILSTLAQTLSQRLRSSVGLNLFRCVVSNTLHDVLGQDIGPMVDRLTIGYPTTSESMLGSLRKIRETLKGLRSYAQGQLDASHAIHWQPVDVGELLRGLHEVYRLSAEKKNLKFELNLPLDIPKLTMDPTLLSRCVGNLVTNAIKYTLTGRIELSVKIKEKFLGIAVEDTGIGIPPDSLKAIFQPGYRVAGEPMAVAEGTGIGLANVQEMVAAVRGRIDVESKLGIGSCFTLYLPLPDSLTEVKAQVA